VNWLTRALARFHWGTVTVTSSDFPTVVLALVIMMISTTIRHSAPPAVNITKRILVVVVGMSWPNYQGIGLAIIWSSVRTLPPRVYGGALCGVAWDAVPEPMVEYIDPDYIKNTCILVMGLPVCPPAVDSRLLAGTVLIGSELEPWLLEL
jgi:hypothetical protein